jgi:hypothetical protein
MVEPISNPKNGVEIGSNQDRSQASAFRDEAEAAGAPVRQYSAQLVKLRYYVEQMHGMLLDTQA